MISVKKYLLNIEAALDRKKTTIVVTGWHIESKQPVVAKIFNICEMSANARDCAFKEVSVMKNLSGHPYMVSVLEFFEFQNQLYLIMEHVQTDLLRYINSNHPIPRKEVERICRQLVEAVEFLHEQNIAHCDIKLENILFDPANKVIRLIDFGHSRIFSEEQPKKTKGIIGSPYYVAPEVFLNTEFNPFKADIYSLGVVFFALNQGALPFKDQNGHRYYAALVKMEDSKLIVRPDLRFNNEERRKKSPKLTAMISKMLDLDSDRRPTLTDLKLLLDSTVSSKHSLLHLIKKHFS